LQRSVNPNYVGWEEEYHFLKSLTTQAINGDTIKVRAAELLA